MVQGGRFVLRVSGGLAAWHDEDCSAPVAFSTRKVGALLSVLALSPRQSAPREQLATLLWSSSLDHQARQSLRQALVLLRKNTRPSEIVETDGSNVRLRPGAVWVDVLELEALAQSSDFGDLTRAADLFRGEILAGVAIKEEPFESWLRQQRRRFEAIGTDVLARHAAAADARGKGPDAIASIERLLALDPLREDWQRLAIRLHVRHHGRNSALAQAEFFAGLLRRELGVEPEAATQHLVDAIRHGAGERGEHPVPELAAAELAATDLPAPDMNVVREAEPGPVPPAPGSPVSAAGTQIAEQPQSRSPTFETGTWRKRWRGPWPGSWTPTRKKVAGVVAGVAIAAGLLLLLNAPLLAPPQILSFVSREEPGAASRLPNHSPSPQAAAARFEQGLVAIIVLPFTANGADQTHDESASEAIAALLTDELTTTLANAGSIRVISRETATTFRGQTVDAVKLGAELGVAYLLEGSASMRGNNLRVNIGLVDTASGVRVWSRRFERTGHDRLAIQDEIINGLCRELQIEVTRISGELGSGAADVHATILQGWSKIHATGIQGKPALEEAEELFSQALDHDPGNTRAQLGLAAYHVNMALQLFAPDPEVHLTKAEALLDALIKRRPHMGAAHTLAGLVNFARRRLTDAKRSLERAIEVSPSHAPAYAQLGRVLLRMGRREEALEHIHYAMRLSPHDPSLAYWLALAGVAELELEHFNQAVAYLDRSLALNPRQPRNVLASVAAQALVGDMDTARRRLEQLQREQPHLSRDALIQRFGKGGLHNAQQWRGLALVLGETSASITGP